MATIDDVILEVKRTRESWFSDTRYLNARLWRAETIVELLTLEELHRACKSMLYGWNQDFMATSSNPLPTFSRSWGVETRRLHRCVLAWSTILRTELERRRLPVDYNGLPLIIKGHIGRPRRA